MADDSAGRLRLSPNLIAGTILAVLAVVLWQQPWKTKAAPEKPTISADAGVVIAAQIRALNHARTETEFMVAAGDTKAARDWAKETYANINLLGASDVRLRFVRGGDKNVRADGATEATVEVSWRPGPRTGLAQQQTKQAEAAFVLDPVKNEKFAIRDAERATGALPLWLAGKLEVTKTAGTTVVSVDGGDSNKAAVVIVLNPKVFATMDARAAQVVMTHEATHLMTGAATADIETWGLRRLCRLCRLARRQGAAVGQRRPDPAQRQEGRRS